eukprot:m.68588 g.68588  ORF g.68588 m.68588 type:complete len:1180 (-) comp7754_c0_seq1:44-3583(-)
MAPRTALHAPLLLLLLALALPAVRSAAPVVLECPPAVVELVADLGGTTATYSYRVHVVDVEDGEIVDTTVGPEQFAIGSTPIVNEFSDSSGLTASCAFTVIVTDEEPPVLNCPSNGTILYTTAEFPNATFLADACPFFELSPGQSSSDDDSCLVTYSDNHIVAGVRASATELGVGNFTVTFRAGDQSSNTVECMTRFDVRVDPAVADALRQEALDNRVAETAKSPEELAGMDEQQQDIYGEALALVASQLSADDVEAVRAVTAAMNAFAGSSSSLSNSARNSVISAGNSIAGLLSESTQATLAAVCGDSTCSLAAAESCVSCSGDCGTCSVDTATSTASVVGLWRRGVTSFGPARVTARIEGALPGGTTLSLEALSASTLPVGVANPTNGLNNHWFAGVAFSLSAVAGGAPIANTLAVDIDISGLGRNIATATRLAAWDTATAAWVPCPGNPVRSENVVTVASVCPGTVFGLFAQGSAPLAVEADLLASVGAVLTSPDSANVTEVDDDKAAINTGATSVVRSISRIMASRLVSLDETDELSASGVTISVGRSDAAQLSNATRTVGDVSVRLPESISGVSGDVAVSMVVFDKNPFNFATTSTGLQNGSIVDFSLSSPSSSSDLSEEISISGLESAIIIVLPGTGNTTIEVGCKFWDEDTQAWSNEGLTFVGFTDDGNIQCAATHLTSFSFTIAKPSVSAKNFDPRNVWVLYSLFGGFLTFVLLVYMYARIERYRYDQRQIQIFRGEIKEDPPLPPPKGSNIVSRTFSLFAQNLKSKHNWIAVVWPTGRKVYPKRLSKVFALIGTVALAFGLNAVFAYTTTVNAKPGEERTVNTAELFGRRIPLEGIYSFFMALPLMLTLSIALGNYSAHIDILQKVAPMRFRAMTPSIRNEMLRRGLVVEPLDKVSRRRKGKEARKNLKESASASALETNPVYRKDVVIPESRTEEIQMLRFGRADSLFNEPDTIQIKRLDHGGSKNTGGDTCSLFDDDLAVDSGYLNVAEGKERGSHLTRRDSLLGELPGSSDKLLADDTCSLFDEEPEMTAKQRADLELISEDEYSEDVELLVMRMKRWRRIAAVVGAFMFVTGLMLTLLWMGSLSSEQQKRWLSSFGEFLVMSAVVTAPFFILIASAMTAYAERRQLKQATATGNKLTNDTKARIKAMIQTELGRNMRQQLLQFHIF